MRDRILTGLVALLLVSPAAAQNPPETDPDSGLIIDQDWQLVLANCSSCHSTRLVIQNRMSAENWQLAIRWMQDKHNLWDLGTNEDKIIVYLEKNYGVGTLPYRRKPLNVRPLDSEIPASEERIP